MKKSLMIILAIGAVLIIVGATMNILKRNENKKQVVNKNYVFIGNYSDPQIKKSYRDNLNGINYAEHADPYGVYNRNGIVKDPKVAYTIAEAILTSIYGKERIENQKPFNISLKNNKFWVVEGTLNQAKMSQRGTATIVISKDDGQVQYLMHSK